MTKQQAARFALGATGIFAAVFLALTIQSHRRFPALTNATQITPEVIAGKDHWHRRNCVNCHTLLGEGAYYAPDLTKIADQRGDAYLMQFLAQPARFYSEAQHRRLMPTPALTEQQRRELIAFLHWVALIRNQNWPPRPILVAGNMPATRATRREQAVSTDPIAQGEALFHATPPGCATCHSTAAGVTMVGPSLAGAGTRAASLIRRPDYTGTAVDAAGYLRESILDPSAYLVPGATFSAGGRSFMPQNFAGTLTAQQIDQLVAYLMSLN